ncbi:hypothetical protein [Actinokineospora globicatena]|uniref:hypothetical protein n=1 Tax=Actinokineospora globicatena TaxID=103729 RepID=UPI002554E3C6|nr:hypothetical protein [Actinokineospora globicatena]
MKWLGVLGLIAVVTLVAVSHRDLGSVLALWLSGKQTSGATLWGLSMVWWGRVGKLLQFLAGCVVVLDLVGPERLRAVGARATAKVGDFQAWRSRMREIRELLELQRAISGWLITRVGSISKVNGDTRRWQPVGPGRWYLPEQPWFTAAMIDDLRATVLSRLPQEHTCAHVHPQELCTTQVEYVFTQVTAFVRDGLPPRERELIDQREAVFRVEKHGCTAIVVTFLALFAGWATFIVHGALTGTLSEWFAIIGPLGAIALFLAAVFMVIGERELPLGLILRGTVVASVTTATAKVLDHTAPGHQLRWLGFLLFVTGFGLDLLSS